MNYSVYGYVFSGQGHCLKNTFSFKKAFEAYTKAIESGNFRAVKLWQNSDLEPRFLWENKE